MNENLNGVLPSEPREIYKLLSEDTMPCLYRDELFTQNKWKRGRVWLVQFLDGRISPIVQLRGRGMGRYVVVVENHKFIVKGYWLALSDVRISKTAYMKYLKNNRYHQLNFSIFQ